MSHRLLPAGAAILAALAISACGGSSGSGGWSAAQKDKVRSELNAEFNIPHSSAELKQDVAAIKNCIEQQLFTHYSPNAHASQKASNKLLYNACGSEVKAFEKAMKAAETKSEKQAITSSGSS